MSSLEKIRSVRLFGLAVFDVVTAYVGVYLLAKHGIGMGHERAVTFSWIFTFPLGVIVHWALGIDTKINRKLGLS